MFGQTASNVMLILLVTSMLVLAVKIQPVRASGTITINADGSITPPTAPISTADNVTYTLTGDIVANETDGIVIERDKRALATGIERGSWNPCWVVSKDHDNKYNRRTKTILQKLRNLHMEESEGNSVQPKGRARLSLAEFFPPRTPMPKGKCGEMPYTEKLDSVKTISIEPDGRVAVCENFHIGNAFKSDIIDILENYDPFKIPEAKSILEKGMDGLIKWAKKRDVEPRPEGYYNICHMCTDLRERASTTRSNSSPHRPPAKD